MNFGDVISACADTGRIKLDKNEMAARLMMPRKYESGAADECEKQLIQALAYKYAFVRVPVRLYRGMCDFSFMRVQSADLYENLCRETPCSEAIILAVTTGIAVDRLLARMRVVSQGRYFICDALASAAAESLCDYAQEHACGGLKCHPRFSPGYGDLPITVQRDILSRLNAGQNLGITLNEACFMTPVKSITAIIGIEGPSALPQNGIRGKAQ